MKDNQVKISVIVPVLNEESHIKKCIDSLVNQEFLNYEIIIIDNGSKDNTMNLIKKYENVILLSENRKGSYIARNRGINLAKGEIIAFTDADCIVHKNWLKELYKGFSNVNIGCVVGSIVPYQGKNIVEIYSRNKDILSQKTTLDTKFLPYGQTANVAFKKDVFNIIGMFDEIQIYGGDADIAWRMQLNTDYKLIYNDDAIIQHRHRTTFKGLFKQQFRYGFGRMMLYKKYDKHMKKFVNNTYDTKYNMFNSVKLILNIGYFCIRSIQRLFGLCDRYHQYEPLLSILFASGYALGKIYGSIKLRESFFKTI